MSDQTPRHGRDRGTASLNGTAAGKKLPRRHIVRAVIASTIGTAIAWYDFFTVSPPHPRDLRPARRRSREIRACA